MIDRLPAEESPSLTSERGRPRARVVGVLAILLATGLLAAGCPDNCLQIQYILCECRGRTVDEINACQNTASTQESLQPPTPEQIKTCGGFVKSCQAAIDGGTACEALQTVAGRQACGIANSN